MNDQISQILARMAAVEDELRTAVQQQESKMFFQIKGKRVEFERSVAEAGRRARTKVRRYCAANGLNRLGTVTYAGSGVHDPLVVRRDLAVFFRNLRGALGGDAFPYVWVPELHPDGHGFHAHFAVGRYVKRSLITDAWGQGFVHIKLLGDLGVGSGRPPRTKRDGRRVICRST